MARVYDISITPEKDLFIESGDFKINESTAQHQECLLIAAPGNYLGSISTGVDLSGHINNDEGAESIKKAVQQHFEADRMKIEKLTLINGSIEVKADYNV